MKISSGIKKRPYFILLYGSDGTGKSTFAGDAPSPIFIGPEKGSSHLNVSRAEDINSWEDVVKSVHYLSTQPHDFKTAAFDSLDWLEPLLWDHICKQENVKSIDEAFGGFGKGYNYALNLWGDFIKSLEQLRDKGLNIIAIAHAQVKTFNDPNQQLPYDRYMLKLNDKAAAKWREAVDVVGFANFEDTVFKLNKTDRKAKATGGEIRKLYVERRPAFDAKNRLGLPPELALSWSEFDRLANLGQPDSLENITKDLNEIMSTLPEDTASKMKMAISKAQGDVTTLLKIRNHARTLGE